MISRTIETFPRDTGRFKLCISYPFLSSLFVDSTSSSSTTPGGLVNSPLNLAALGPPWFLHAPFFLAFATLGVPTQKNVEPSAEEPLFRGA